MSLGEPESERGSRHQGSPRIRRPSSRDRADPIDDLAAGLLQLDELGKQFGGILEVGRHEQQDGVAARGHSRR